MSDAFGSVSLPIQTSGQLPVGDPALGYLGDFLKAVINGECASAWGALRPRPGATERDAALPVRNVFVEDPKRGTINSSTLPAIYLWRTEDALEERSLDWIDDTGNIAILWVVPPDTPEKKVPRSAFGNAIGKAVAARVTQGRDPRWQVAGDTNPASLTKPEDTDAIFLSRATSLSPTTLSGAQLDGAIGASGMSPRRELMLTGAAVAVPTYNTASPVVVTGIDGLGVQRTWSLLFTSQLGGTIRLGDEVASVISVLVPGQVATGGHIELGVAQFDGEGTVLADAANLIKPPLVKKWQPKPLDVQVIESSGRPGIKLTYDAVEITIEIEEVATTDPDAHPLWGLAKAGTTITKDGFAASTASFPDAGS